jgi:glycerol-3-phosphate dehydrogenase (NAD(P)+)
VLGTGSWGTAFAKVLADAGTDVVLWARRPELAAAVRDTHENPDYLPGIALPANLTATADPREAVDGAEFVVLAVPSQSLRDNLSGVADALAPGSVLVSLMKGVELGTTKRMSEVVIEVADVPADRVAVVSGPNLAKEIAQGQPAATVVACSDADACTRLQEASTTAYFRPYTNGDVVGCGTAARSSAAGRPSKSWWRRSSRPPRASRAAARSSTSPASTTSTCPSPRTSCAWSTRASPRATWCGR